MTSWLHKFELPLLLFITCIGGIVRFYNLNWDSGHFFHPDERNIANAVTRIHFFDKLNPEFFAYGGFSMYLYRAIGDGLVFITGDPTWVSDWGHINLIARFCSALFATFAILAIYFLGRALFSKETGLLAAFFTAFTVSFIQEAHFGVTESFLTLVTILLCFFCVQLLHKPTLRHYLACAILVGVGTAAKTSALSFLIMPAVAQLFIMVKHRHHIVTYLMRSIIFLGAAVLLFTLFSPYTFLSWGKFLESMHYESGVALGTLPVPYTLQFTHTTAYLFQFKNFFWQMGAVAFLIIPGLVLLFIEAVRKGKLKYVIFLSFPIIYFLYVGAWHTKFVRYMIPLLPFFILAVAHLLIWLQKELRWVGRLLLTVSCLASFLWALAFFSIYTREQTRITASQWMYDNIPPESKILTEHWDDGLPVDIGSFKPGSYTSEQLTIYEPDNQEKIIYYAEKLSQADYIIINSRRLYGTLLYLPDKYPITSKYYQLLFDRSLGYDKVAQFTSYPSLFGLEINDDGSEESFQVYEHPKVLIFKNNQRFSKEDIMAMLGYAKNTF